MPRGERSAVRVAASRDWIALNEPLVCDAYRNFGADATYGAGARLFWRWKSLCLFAEGEARAAVATSTRVAMEAFILVFYIVLCCVI